MLVNRCDCCTPPCVCGAFCSNAPYCGYNLDFVATLSGALGGCDCATSMDITFPIVGRTGISSYSAAQWNTDFAAVYGFTNAKADSTVCVWYGASALASSYCPFPSVFWNLTFPTVFIVFGTDDKWRICYMVHYEETDLTVPSVSSCDLTSECFLDQDVGSNAGNAVDCGTVGEGTPTYTVDMPLAQVNVVGSVVLCSLPTNVVVEGNPQ